MNTPLNISSHADIVTLLYTVLVLVMVFFGILILQGKGGLNKIPFYQRILPATTVILLGQMYLLRVFQTPAGAYVPLLANLLLIPTLCLFLVTVAHLKSEIYLKKIFVYSITFTGLAFSSVFGFVVATFMARGFFGLEHSVFVVSGFLPLIGLFYVLFKEAPEIANAHLNERSSLAFLRLMAFYVCVFGLLPTLTLVSIFSTEMSLLAVTFGEVLILTVGLVVGPWWCLLRLYSSGGGAAK